MSHAPVALQRIDLIVLVSIPFHIVSLSDPYTDRSTTGSTLLEVYIRNRIVTLSPPNESRQHTPIGLWHYRHYSNPIDHMDHLEAQSYEVVQLIIFVFSIDHMTGRRKHAPVRGLATLPLHREHHQYFSQRRRRCRVEWVEMEDMTLQGIQDHWLPLNARRDNPGLSAMTHGQLLRS